MKTTTNEKSHARIGNDGDIHGLSYRGHARKSVAVLTVGSLFAGIGGFDLGFERAGCQVLWQVEADGKAQSVLSARFPNAALHSDVRTANGLERVDVITGGFPCQDVSVAGKREGLGGERTGLFWQVVRIARELQPRWMVLENVPGLLSSHGGRNFHAVLVALAECGFRRAYRILDSRYFGVAQRRRRVFVVLRARDAGDGAGPVLFESARRHGDSPARPEAGARVAATLRGRSHGVGVNAPGRGGEDDQNLIAFAPATAACLNPGHEAKHSYAGDEGTLNIVAMGVHANQRGELRTSDLAGSLNGSRSGKQYEGVFATLNSGGNDGGFRTEPGEHLIGVDMAHALTSSSTRSGRLDPNGETFVAFQESQSGARTDDVHATLDSHNGSRRHNGAMTRSGVRRLTPLEYERLQGFPDGWTCLCGNGHRGSSFCSCADSPRYKQLGNAVTVNVAEWIARRLIAEEASSFSTEMEPAPTDDAVARSGEQVTST